MNNLSFYLEKLDIVENVRSPSYPETAREGGRVEGEALKSIFQQNRIEDVADGVSDGPNLVLIQYTAALHLNISKFVFIASN